MQSFLILISKLHSFQVSLIEDVIRISRRRISNENSLTNERGSSEFIPKMELVTTAGAMKHLYLLLMLPVVLSSNHKGKFKSIYIV